MSPVNLLYDIAVAAARDDARDGDVFIVPGVDAMAAIAAVAEERGLRLDIAHHSDEIPAHGRVFILLDSVPSAEQMAQCRQLASANRLSLWAFPRTTAIQPAPDLGLHQLVADRDADGVRLTYPAQCPDSPLWVLVDPIALSVGTAPLVDNDSVGDAHSEVASWVEAARSYLGAGLPAAAKAALARAGTLQSPLWQHAERQQRIDAALAEAMTTSEHPLLPVMGSGTAPLITTLPSPAAGADAVRFSQALVDEVVAGALEPILRAFVLHSVAAGTTLLDLSPNAGHLAFAVTLAGLPSPSPAMVERNAARRHALSSGNGPGAPTPQVCESVLSAVTEVAKRALPAGVLVHATLTAITDGSLTSAVLALREAKLAFSVVVSEVNDIVAARDATVKRLLSLAPLLDLEVRSVGVHRGQFITSTLAELPRPQLLVVC